MGNITEIKEIPANITIALEAIVKFSKYLVIPTAVTTFFPDPWLQHMNLLSIKNSSFGMWISMVFWMCISVVMIDLLQKLLTIFVSIHHSKKLKRHLAKNMENLTDREKDIVYEIFIHDTYELDVLGDAAGESLRKQGIIFHAEMGDRFDGVSCGLQPIAREYLSENPNYLKDHVKGRKEHIVTELEKLKEDMFDFGLFDPNVVQKTEEIEQLKQRVEEYDQFIEKKI